MYKYIKEGKTTIIERTAEGEESVEGDNRERENK